ncbi:sulfatase-like hydrolase/transferase [Seohaeicola saemankumensis]|nr:sulfatase-like hydrolase/transferase [Seohaeicola saemankumensis]MCA0869985.1 sulfatase-like hydrolase/transferase [Seohaeicola saemankumensis]
MKTTVAIAIATAALALTLWAGPVRASDRPNVVLMLADNLGFGDLSVYNGGTRGGFRTPNIDSLAAEGLRLTQFLVEPGCTPSRAALQTGQYSIRNGMSLIIAPGASGGLQDDDITLGELFKSVGYDTTYVGKWHLGPQPVSQPQNQGFDQWLVGFAGTTDSSTYGDNLRALGMGQDMVDAFGARIIEARGPGEAAFVRPYDSDYRKQIEGDIAAAASGYIRQQAETDTPFFLMIGWTRPHFPNDTADEFVGLSGAGKYGDSVMELDLRTGEILAAIEDAGLRDRTIVIWLSDNGATVTATAIDEVHAGDNGPFRGELGDAYEGSIRTAGMIRWPGEIEPRVSNEMFAIHDFFPTLAAIIGAELPDDRPIDGVDQTGFLLGASETSARDSLITFIGDRIAAVRWRQFRMYPFEIGVSDTNPAVGGYMGVKTETAGFPQIYNIEADPKERVNLAHAGAGWAVALYLQTIQQYLATLVEYPNPPAPNVTDFR